MAGLILIGLSALIFIALIVISKKNKDDNKSQLYNQNSKKELENTTELTDLSIKNESECLELYNQSEDEGNVLNSSANEQESFNPKSYKDDEEYRQMASLVKNIYFSLVTIVFVILGILYFIFLS